MPRMSLQVNLADNTNYVYFPYLEDCQAAVGCIWPLISGRLVASHPSSDNNNPSIKAISIIKFNM